MELIHPATGEVIVRKTRERFNHAGDARELTFSCFHGYPFLLRDRTRKWFRDSLEKARAEWHIDVWAYVIMPEHVHLIVWPRNGEHSVTRFLQTLKSEVGRRGIAYLAKHAPSWLPRLTVTEGNRKRRRFWQPGGGYDRNVIEPATLLSMIDYIHANPIRRSLVRRAEDWEWSSARWFLGIRPVPIWMDSSVLDVLVGLSDSR
jgi:putative transposase